MSGQWDSTVSSKQDATASGQRDSTARGQPNDPSHQGDSAASAQTNDPKLRHADDAEERNTEDETVDCNSDASMRANPRSRQKRDMFHILQDLPIPLRDPGRNLISRLLILASSMFDTVEYKEYAAFLQNKHGIDCNKLLDNFYFNRETWRQHVRMYRPDAEHHAERIRNVHQFVASSTVLKSLYTPDLKTYLEMFEAKCREGKFEETNDVDSFIYAGIVC